MSASGESLALNAQLPLRLHAYLRNKSQILIPKYLIFGGLTIQTDAIGTQKKKEINVWGEEVGEWISGVLLTY